MTAAEIKREFEVGREFCLTNYYITRPDHPCYGARKVTIASVNTNSVKTLDPDGEIRKIEWPKAAQLKKLDHLHGTIAFYGGGCGQSDDELFVTFEALS